MEVLKRLLKIIIFILTFPLMFPAVMIGLPIATIIEVILYIFKGREFNADITLAPIEYTFMFPFVIIERINQKWKKQK